MTEWSEWVRCVFLLKKSKMQTDCINLGTHAVTNSLKPASPIWKTASYIQFHSVPRNFMCCTKLVRQIHSEHFGKICLHYKSGPYLTQSVFQLRVGTSKKSIHSLWGFDWNSFHGTSPHSYDIRIEMSTSEVCLQHIISMPLIYLDMSSEWSHSKINGLYRQNPGRL